MPIHRILLIDDHAMFRSGLGMVLNTNLVDIQIFQAGSLNEAINNTHGKMNVVLLDIQLNGLNGLDGIALLKQKWPQAPIVVLSSHDEQDMIQMSLARGATCFVSKAETAEQIVSTINLLLHEPQPNPRLVDIPSAVRKLTPRQLEVLELLHQGLSNKLIAQKLELSNNTVRRHVQDILEFFGVASRAEAVFSAFNRGLLR